jgi:hypothetical protein
MRTRGGATALDETLLVDVGLQKGQVLSRDRVLAWFNQKYPLIKKGTIAAHLILFSTNAPSRKHYGAKPTDDLYYQVDSGSFRLYDPASDPQPIYPVSQSPGPPPMNEVPEPEPPSEFAYESDLRDFLAKNLAILEPGLRLFQDEGITGIEFPAGGRLIDILAIDLNDNYVVIELKVSKGSPTGGVTWDCPANLPERANYLLGILACGATLLNRSAIG